jgi:putative FmdB family regulatory protein
LVASCWPRRQWTSAGAAIRNSNSQPPTNNEQPSPKMPTYEYKCEACGHAFEKFQSIKAAPIRKCPNCGKKKVKKLISKGAGLIFKGSGFYITDYRSKGYTDQAKSESGEAKAQPTEAGKADAKPAASTEGSSATKPAPESNAPKNNAPKNESKSEAKSAASTPSKSESKSANSSKSDKR